MPHPIPTKRIIKTLEKEGFVFVSQRGSHVKYCRIDTSVLTVIVPINEKEVRYGTFRSILRQSGLRESDFKRK